MSAGLETAMVGAPGAAAGMPGDAAGVATDLPNFPYPWYISQMRQMLWAAWQKRMPPASGEGVVMFAIVRNGAFTDLRMESSSGDSAFDQAAMVRCVHPAKAETIATAQVVCASSTLTVVDTAEQAAPDRPTAA